MDIRCIYCVEYNHFKLIDMSKPVSYESGNNVVIINETNRTLFLYVKEKEKELNNLQDHINYLEKRLKALEKESKQQKQENEIKGIFGEWSEF